MIFIQPAFLWGMLALLIPIAVHLFNFRRYRKVYFSNVDRLSAIRTESRRTSTLRRWLVLLMRCLAIVALVLAFAQPTLPSSGQRLQPGTAAVSVYIDNSFSMENSGSDGSLLETAKQKAREIASAYRPGDRFQLLSNTLAGEEFRWLSRDEFLEAVDALQVNPASRRLSEAAQRQVDFLRQGNIANCHAYLISDFQTSTADLNQLSCLLPGRPATEEEQTLNSQLSTLNFTLVPLEGTATDNLYIDTLVLDAPAYFVGGHVTVEATVRNDGSRAVEKLPVRLYVNGRERALATLDLPAGSAAKASLRFTLDSAGWLNGHVDIDDYPITFDDRYHFSLLAGERIAMLHAGNANENLEKLFASDSALHYRTTAANSLAVGPDLHVVLLNELTDLPSGQAQALASWVADGGTLVVVPPADGKVEALNALLALLSAPHLGEWSPRTVRATTVDFQSSLYHQVFSQGKGTQDMELPTVQGHYLMATGQSLCQPIITLADGSLLLASSPHGAGRLYLFSTPLTAQHTDLVSQALFVPTLYNMALYSRPLPPPAYTLGSSDPIFLQHSYDGAEVPPTMAMVSSSFSSAFSTPLPPSKGGTAAASKEGAAKNNPSSSTEGTAAARPLPAGRGAGEGVNIDHSSNPEGFDSFLPDIRRVGSRSALIPHGELTLAGHYSLGDEYLSFNYDRSESQLRFYTPAQVDSAFDGHEGFSVIRNAAKPLDREIRALRNGTPLWHWCLLLALAALLAEILLLKVPQALKDSKLNNQ